MKLIQYIKEVVLFNPSQKEYDQLKTEKERYEYRMKIIKGINFISTATIVVGMTAIVISIISLTMK